MNKIGLKQIILRERFKNLDHQRLRYIFIILLVAALLSGTIFFLILGLPTLFTSIPSYNLFQLTARVFKGGTSIGYKLAYIGTVLLIIAQLYSFRKRLGFNLGRKIGGVARWLNTHCYINIVAPILILIHSGFPFSFTYANPFRFIRIDWGIEGLVGFQGLAAWLVLVSTLSGFFGKYLYRRLNMGYKGWFKRWRIFHIFISSLLYISGTIHMLVAVYFKYISAA